MDAIDLLQLPTRPLKALCRIPRDLDEVASYGDEVPPAEVAATPEGVDGVWRAVRKLYGTGLYPAVQICIRRHGGIVLHRALGHAAGNGPRDPRDGPRTPLTLDTPFLLYSASKAITAMVIHKLDERNVLHLEDRVADYLPEFGVEGKQYITLRHVLCHRAGIPNLPRDSLNLDLLEDPERLIEILCAIPRTSRPGRRLSYHAITGGFVLGEVVQRATGQDIREVLHKEIVEPLGFRWFDYGTGEPDAVARDAVTGLPVLPPFSWFFERVLGTGFENVVRLANDPRFLRGIVPSANVVANAEEVSAFYQCLLDGGQYEGVRIFEPRTIRHATAEQTYLEFDFTLGLPLRYGLGFMLGGETVSLFGTKTRAAFGHLGFTNIITWADPDRQLSVALLTSGKPFLNLEVTRLLNLIIEIGRAFPEVQGP